MACSSSGVNARGFFACTTLGDAVCVGARLCCGESVDVFVGLEFFSSWSVDHVGNGFKRCSVMVGRLDPAVWECFCFG